MNEIFQRYSKSPRSEMPKFQQCTRMPGVLAKESPWPRLQEAGMGLPGPRREVMLLPETHS